MLRKPETIQYPEEKRNPSPRYRARIVLTRDPDGGRALRRLLPVQGRLSGRLHLHAGGGAEDGRRYAAWFRINFSRCIFCGLCAEACPTLAIQMSPDYEICTATRWSWSTKRKIC